jgi:DNA-binding MarR family transcriptional regulator
LWSFAAIEGHLLDYTILIGGKREQRITAAQSIEGHFEKALAAVNLSGPKFAALSGLVAEDQPISLGDLEEKLTCVRSNVTQLADRLGADGLVKRTR